MRPIEASSDFIMIYGILLKLKTNMEDYYHNGISDIERLAIRSGLILADNDYATMAIPSYLSISEFTESDEYQIIKNNNDDYIIHYYNELQYDRYNRFNLMVKQALNNVETYMDRNCCDIRWY